MAIKNNSIAIALVDTIYFRTDKTALFVKDKKEFNNLINVAKLSKKQRIKNGVED